MILGKKRYGNVPEVKIIHTMKRYGNVSEVKKANSGNVSRAKIKKSKNDSMKRYGNVSEEEERPSLPDDIYCGLIETLSEKCFVTSLLEMWR